MSKRTGERSPNAGYALGKFADYLEGHWIECGLLGGRFAAAMLLRGAETVTVATADPDPDYIERARDRWAYEPRLRFVSAGDGRLPLGDGLFEGVLVNQVLEHALDEKHVLEEVARVLKPGGHTCLITSSRLFPFERHAVRIGRRVVRTPLPVVPWLPRKATGRLTTARNYWPREASELLRATGFEIVEQEFILPELVVHPWLPPALLDAYRNNIEKLDGTPLRRFGVSTLTVGKKPSARVV